MAKLKTPAVDSIVPAVSRIVLETCLIEVVALSTVAAPCVLASETLRSVWDDWAVVRPIRRSCSCADACARPICR